ncbi:hypothetical protein N7509_005492 [Penicillium cosmopolitanum]|uniref:Uncharacterized protein n=1 Tax=Penicillium cosmopolitanum TaxID=1131564 RepID=A0A9W9W2C1_9EURO|nr:uncharacterized protein N7509_005492 [Penicillium cosmopolitanum]KAJ5397379.1 hypothetical protein N7509_005492 [Penicillium cosmopolitanum]
MARRYKIDELIWLRDSPLVAKPPGLPPIEEWMPQPDPTTQRKQPTTRDPNNPSETTTNRRPSFFEARHISRGSNSDEIVLGPPKTNFASSRIGGKGSFDLTDRPARPNETDEKNDRFNFRDRIFKEKDTTQERDYDRRDGRPAALNGRRGEKEDWNAGRTRRTFPPEEQERKPRRTGEFDRWENREAPRDPLNSERGVRDRDGRFPARKEGQPTTRTKYDGSWFREENGNEAIEADDDKPALRNREWRRDRHGADRDWARGTAKVESEPEWLDANDRDEPRRAHTQEDFERWKERMKAGSGTAQPPPSQAERKEEYIESDIPTQKPETHRTDGEIFSSGAQFMGDTSMDRFFGMLGEPKPPVPEAVASPVQVQSTPQKDNSYVAKSGKSSRFAGLFSPPPDSPFRAPESPALPKSSAGSTPANPQEADQEGFQRILAMLGGPGAAGPGHGPPHGTPHQNEHSRPSPMVHPDHARAAMNMSSPVREHMGRPDFASPSQEIPLAQMAGKEPHPGERDHLLRLMQQVQIGPGPQGGVSQRSPNAGPAPPPGLMPEMMPRPPPGLTGQKTPNFFDDPAIANMQRPDNEQLRRRAPNGPPMGYFEDIPFPQGGQGPMTPGGSRPPNQPPMPLQRPPGLEHLPPPGWTGQPPPQQGNGPSPMGPHPGMPTPNRGMMPMPGNGPPLGERQGFPPRGPPGPPPGMMPPPGYMGGPPPGFPPMPPNPEAMMGLGPGGQGPFGPGNPGPQGPPPSSRHLLEMFGQSGGGEVRGGMVGPGPYR